jgi:hypothetical protein
MLLNEMGQAKHGIENLKHTYQNDQNVISQLDIIIMKINTALKDYTTKLKFFYSLIPNKENNADTQLQFELDGIFFNKNQDTNDTSGSFMVNMETIV